MTDLSIISYNLHGFNSGRSLLADLCMTSDIIYVQEHWLIPNKLNLIETFNSDFNVTAKSTMETNVLNEVITGRPFGDTAILWRRDLTNNVTNYYMNECGKCIGISFPSKEEYCFVFNEYMPCLSQFDDDVEIKVVECMSFIDSVVQEFMQSSGVCNINIIIAGDYNASLHNIYNDNRLNAVRSLLNDFGLVCCDDVDVSDVGYTFYNETLGYKSYIDHIFISAEYKQCINSVEVVDNGCNLSDHLPVKMSIKLNVMKEFETNNANHMNNNYSNYVCWDSVFKEKYYESSGKVLMNLAQLNFCCMECSDRCSNREHTSIIDEWCDNVINESNRCVEQCRVKNSEVHSSTKGSVLWSEELKKLKQQSFDVHNLWKMCGKPRMGTINDERLRVKGLYKAYINTHKRVLETRKREWLVYKLASGDGKGFWKGWR